MIISTSGTKTAQGNVTVVGDFEVSNTSGCLLDMESYSLTVGGITVGPQNGLDLTHASSSVTLNGSSAQTITHTGMETR